jgi:hypothetical protein
MVPLIIRYHPLFLGPHGNTYSKSNVEKLRRTAHGLQRVMIWLGWFFLGFLTMM